MPPAAMLGVSAGIGAIGNVISAKVAQPKNVPTPAPTPLFPWLNQDYSTQLRSSGKVGMEGLTSMAQTGEPVGVGDTFSTMLQAQQRLLSQGRAGLREQFGSQGTIASTGFRDAAVDFESQQAKDFASIMAQLVMTSGENAANRKLTASGSLTDMFSTSAQAYTPTSTLVTGSPSAAGAGLGSLGQSGMMLALMRMLKQPVT